MLFTSPNKRPHKLCLNAAKSFFNLDIILIVFTFIFTQQIYAITLTTTLPMRLFAQKADLDQKTHTGRYSGDVALHQGNNHLRAARAITKTDQQNQFIKAIAYGDAQKQVHFWSKADPEKPVIHAFADKIRYLPNQHTIELIGHARVKQGKNTFIAPYIHYDIKKEQVTSHANGKSLIHILFYP